MSDPADVLVDPGKVVFAKPDGGRMRLVREGDDGTVWMTQAEMAEFFGTNARYISSHVVSIYDTKELDEEATCRACLRVDTSGPRKLVHARKAYNLDLILAVGFRLATGRAARFRNWAARCVQQVMKGRKAN